MKSVRFLIVLPAIALLLSGCGSSEQLQKEPASPAEEKEQRVLLSHYERTFNPSDFDDEIAEIQKQHVLERQKAAEQEVDSVVVESEFSQGYRIQIFASGNIDEANAMRMTAAQHITDDSLYVVFDPPVYKVRVGDFRTRAEANQRLGVVIGEGFSDAWVVGDRIVLRKLVRVQAQPPQQK
jgi:hypothetical protein